MFKIVVVLKIISAFFEHSIKEFRLFKHFFFLKRPTKYPTILRYQNNYNSLQTVNVQFVSVDAPLIIFFVCR